MARKLVSNQDNTSTSSQTEPLTRAVARPIFGENVLAIDYNFAEKGILDDDITFSRASGATQTNSEGKVAFAPHNEVPYTTDVGGTGWTNNLSVGITANQADPFGGNEATRLQAPNDQQWSNTRLNLPVNLVANQPYVYSVYIKQDQTAATTTQVRLGIQQGSTWIVSQYATMTNGSFEFNSLQSRITDTKIETLDDGWFRVSYSYTTNIAGTHKFAIYPDTQSVSGTGAVWVYGPQHEKTLTPENGPTSYYRNETSGNKQAPRFDYDKDGNSKGLLIEEARTNLDANSFAVGTLNQSTSFAASNEIDPSGGTSSYKVVPDTSSGFHYKYRTYTVTDATVYTYSVYVKPDGIYKHLLLNAPSGNAAGNAGPIFNLETGQQESFLTADHPTTVTECGNGWYRISVQYTTSGTLLRIDHNILPTTATSSYSGDGSSGMLFWGSQLELGSFPTSLIPTYGATASRAADIASVSGTNFSRFFKDTEGTFVVDAQMQRGFVSGNQSLFAVSDSSASDHIRMYLSTSEKPVASVRTLNSGEASVSTNVDVSSGEIFTSSFGYKTNNTRAFTDNATSNLDTDVDLPTNIIELTIGHRYNNLKQLNGWIRRLRYFNKRKSDSQLQKLTSQDKLLQRFKGAKAAHSLRSLRDGRDNSAVTRIRRSYDSHEADYTAAQVSNGELENDFKSEKQTTLPLDVSVEADEMVVNGTFDSTTAPWGISAGGQTVELSGGGMRISTDGTLAYIAQGLPVVKGKTYRVTGDIKVTSGSGSFSFLGQQFNYNSTQSFSEDLVATATTSSTTFMLKRTSGGSASDFIFDNISVKEVNPIATGFSTRKINSSYTGKAMRCRNQGNVEVEVGFDSNNEISLSSPVTNTSQNLLPSSEDFGTNWSLDTCTLEKYSGLDPFGGYNATKITATGGASSGPYYVLPSTAASTHHTLSVYIKAEEPTRTRIGFYRTQSGTWVNIETDWSASGTPTTASTTNASNINYEAIGSDGWYRVSLVGITDNATYSTSVNLDPDSGGNNKSAIFFGAQLEETQYSSTSPATEKVTNGTFTADRELYWDDDNNSGTPGWWHITNPSASSVSNGRAILDSSTGTADARQDVPVTAGKQYVISVTMSEDSGGQGVFYMSDGANYSYAFGSFNATTTETTFTKTVVPTQNIIRLYAHAPNSSGKAYYSDISIKEYDPELQTYAQTPVISDDGSNTTATTLGEFSGKENLVPYSEDFSANFWTKQTCSQVPNSGTDPNGGNTATKIVPVSTGTNRGLVYIAGSNLDNIVYNWSVYVKKGLSDYAYFTKGANGSWGSVWFNLETGEVGTVQTGWSNVTMTSVGNDWYRISATVTMAGTSDYLYILQADSNGSATVTKDGDKGLLVWGAQLNTNSLKDYQKTTGTALTGDVNVVNWYDQAGGEDFVNSTAGEQPRIVMGSELVTDSGGKASVYFDGGDTLQNSTLAGQDRLDIYAIQNTSDDPYIYPADPTAGANFAAVADDSSGDSSIEANFGTPSYYVNGALQSFSDRDDVHDALTGSTKLFSQHNASTSSWGNLEVGHYGGSSNSTYNFTGKISEMVFFPNMDSSPKRFPIEQNMLRHFDVNLVTNGTFDTDTNWTKGTGWSIASGVAASDGSQSSNSGLIQYNVHTSGKTYTLTFDVVSTNSEPIKFWVNGVQNIFTSALGVGTHTYTYTAQHTGTAYFEATAAFVGSIDNVKVQEYGVSGFINTLYDQAGNNCHAVQSTAALQPQIVSGGDLIKSGNHPAWEYTTGGTNKNLVIQGLGGLSTLDAFFVQEFDPSKVKYVYPAGGSGASGMYYGFEASDGNTSTGIIGTYGGASYEVNGTLKTPNRDEIHGFQDEHALVYHRSAATTNWPFIEMGHYNGDAASAWNIDKAKFSEWIWYDSDQHSNQSGIESNINTHYNIY